MTVRPPTKCPWVLAVLLSAVLAGCAATNSAAVKQPPYRVVNGATYVPVATADREYSREAATLELPPAHAWPQDPLPKSDSGSPAWYEIGYARQAADRYWFCSWAAMAVNASDVRARREAVEALQGILRLYYYTNALDAHSRPQLAKEVTSAQKGDLTALRTDVQLNC